MSSSTKFCTWLDNPRRLWRGRKSYAAYIYRCSLANRKGVPLRRHALELLSLKILHILSRANSLILSHLFSPSLFRHDSTLIFINFQLPDPFSLLALPFFSLAFPWLLGSTPGHCKYIKELARSPFLLFSFLLFSLNLQLLFSSLPFFSFQGKCPEDY